VKDERRRRPRLRRRRRRPAKARSPTTTRTASTISTTRAPTRLQGPNPDPDRPGCPDGDFDKDGVFDHKDACPGEPQGMDPDPNRPGCPSGVDKHPPASDIGAARADRRRDSHSAISLKRRPRSAEKTDRLTEKGDLDADSLFA
jgi:hypothetical protein